MIIIINNAHLEMKLFDGTTLTINGIVTEYETTDYPLHYRETTVTIRESAYELMHPQTRCNLTLFKEEEEEDKSMSVKIKKQPKEISLEEFKKGEEFEEVRIYIDKDKREEIESKYGISYDYASKLFLSDDEIKFKENYLITRCGNVPYSIINKIEVVEK